MSAYKQLSMFLIERTFFTHFYPNPKVWIVYLRVLYFRRRLSRVQVGASTTVVCKMAPGGVAVGRPKSFA